MPQRMGSDLTQWGPCAWNTLHLWAHTYPRAPSVDEQAAMRTLLHLFAHHLPCPRCRRHFEALLHDTLTDEALASRDSLVAFTNDAHNAVNARLGKRVYTLAEHYRVYRHRRPSTPVFFPAALVPIALVVAAVVVTHHHRRLKKFLGV